VRAARRVVCLAGRQTQGGWAPEVAARELWAGVVLGSREAAQAAVRREGRRAGPMAVGVPRRPCPRVPQPR